MVVLQYTEKDHTFMICAYKENPYLEQCIKSVLNQTKLGYVKISTSTPNEYIKNLAIKYDLPLVVNDGIGNQADNLNFAYSHAETELVTLCHQDDYYEPGYLEKILFVANKSKQPLILFTDYFEERNGKRIDTNLILKIKRIMLLPIRSSFLRGKKMIKRLVLSFGCPICCPAVTFCKTRIEALPFRLDVQTIDYDAWVRMYPLKGEFVYCSDKLVAHRIWEGSGTTEIIKNDIRTKEDYEIFCKFWPKPIAKVLVKAYSLSERSNNLEK